MATKITLTQMTQNVRRWMLPTSASIIAGITIYDRFIRTHGYFYTAKNGKLTRTGLYHLRGVFSTKIRDELQNILKEEHKTFIITKVQRIDHGYWIGKTRKAITRP